MNLMCWLHFTHGFGVSPARYASTKSSTTAAPNSAGEIDDVVRDAEVRAHRARVLDVARAAAPAAERRRRAARVVEPHRHADDAMALLDEQRRGGGAIDAARQGGDDE